MSDTLSLFLPIIVIVAALIIAARYLTQAERRLGSSNPLIYFDWTAILTGRSKLKPSERPKAKFMIWLLITAIAAILVIHGLAPDPKPHFGNELNDPIEIGIGTLFTIFAAYKAVIWGRSYFSRR
jgi:hypothetical protein